MSFQKNGKNDGRTTLWHRNGEKAGKKVTMRMESSKGVWLGGENGKVKDDEFYIKGIKLEPRVSYYSKNKKMEGLYL